MWMQIRYGLSLIILSSLALLTPLEIARPIDSCPGITLECISDNSCCGPYFEFRVRVTNTRPTDKITYKWSVSAGTITSGQDTASIEVDATENAGQSITATVEIDGLEPNCDKAHSMTQAICDPAPSSRLFDQYGNISFSKEKSRLHQFAIQLEQEPGARGYIIVYGGRLKRAERAKDYLVTKYGIDPTRIEIIEGGERQGSTVELYIRPTGAEAPAANPPK